MKRNPAIIFIALTAIATCYFLFGIFSGHKTNFGLSHLMAAIIIGSIITFILVRWVFRRSV